jgi:hypothetical protein
VPTYNVTSPDGKQYRITAPDGATQEDVMAYAKAQFSNKPDTPTGEMGIMPRLAQGLQDPVNALAQMAHNAVPETVSGAINAADNWLYDKTGGLVGSAQEDFNQRVQEQEALYQQARQEAGQSGFDGARLSGNLLATLPAVMAAPSPGAKSSLLSKTAYGAGLGGLLGAANPVTEQGDFLSQKAGQVGMGAAGGAIAAPIGAGLGRMIAPMVDKSVKTLMREGITPSPGQILGGSAKAIEEKARSLPIMGDFISNAQRKSVDQLNRAAYNRALNPIGQDAAKLQVGREGVAMVKKKLSDAYEELLPKLSFKADSKFTQGLSKLRSLADELEPKYQAMFEKTLKDKVIGKMTPQGNMSGTTLKSVEGDLGRLAKGYQKNPDFGGRQLGDAIEEMQHLIRQTVERANPEYAAQLQAINKGYANYAVIRSAASRAGAQDGFTAAQLASAGRMADKSVGRGSTATGKALMQDLTDPGTRVLTQRYPDSGTAGRLLFDTGALAAGFMHPGIPLGLLGGGLPYTQVGQKILSGLLTKRPEGAAQVADLVRRSSPALGSQLFQ